MSVCLSVWPSVQAVTFKRVDLETSFLVEWYIFPISRLGSRSYIGKCLFGYLGISLTWFYMSKIKVISRSSFSRSNCVFDFLLASGRC